jgi:hypothetical protein
MLANWRSTRVKERRLTEKNEWPVGSESSLRFDNIFKRAPNVNGRSPRTLGSSPRNGSTQGIVNLEGAGAVTETLQPHAVIWGQLRACHPKKLPGSDAGENEVSFRTLCNFVVDFNTAVKTFQIASEGIWESLSAATQNRPAARVPGPSKIKPTAAEVGASNESTE